MKSKDGPCLMSVSHTFLYDIQIGDLGYIYTLTFDICLSILNNVTLNIIT